MTKETKIGLLVGLAFIILFAIILSEKGTPHRNARAPTFDPLETAVAGGARGTQGAAMQGEGKLPVDSQLSPLINQGPKLAPPPLTEEPVAQGPEAPLDEAASAGDETVGPSPAPPEQNGPERVVVVSPGEGASTPGPYREEYVPPAAATERPGEPLLEERRMEPAIGPEPSAPARTNAAREAVVDAAPTPRIRIVHEVKPGESLSRIVADQYGRATKPRIDALYQANRDVLPSPDRLKAGMKLRIPDLGEASSSFEPVSNFAAASMEDPVEIRKDSSLRIPLPAGEKSSKARPARAEAGQSKKPPALRRVESPRQLASYVVRRGDTLSKIARQRLGSERRVKELRQLNVDRLKKGDRLKPGMVIRLPQATGPVAEGGTAVTSRGMEHDEP